MGGMKPVHWNLHTLLTDWQLAPFPLFVVACLVAVACWYLQADWKLAARGRRWPARRRYSFFLGLVMVDLALESPIAGLTASYFQAHVIQHLLLMVCAPVLLALGAPSTLLLQTSGRSTKVRWLKVLHSFPFKCLTFPVVVWFLYFGAMVGFFLSSGVNYAMHHMDLMDAINVVFLLGGCLYWWPMVGIDPVMHWKMTQGFKIINLLIAAPFEAFLGISIMSQHSPIATMYSLSSTHAGGGILWAATELSVLGGLIPVYLQWVRSDRRAAARVDSRLAHASARAAEAPSRVRVPPDPAVDGTWATLFQPGNSTWEQMWRAKAGHVPKRG